MQHLVKASQCRIWPSVLNEQIDGQFEASISLVGICIGLAPVGSFICPNQSLGSLPCARSKRQESEELPDLRRRPSRSVDSIDPLPTADAKTAPDKSGRELGKLLLPRFQQAREYRLVDLRACHRAKGYPDATRRLDRGRKRKNRLGAPVGRNFLYGILATSLKVLALIFVVSFLFVQVEIPFTEKPLVAERRCARR